MIEDVGVSVKVDPELSHEENEPLLPLLPIALPLVGGATLVEWLRSSYKRVPGVQQRFIAYIVDLTHVMTILFNLTASDRGKALTRRTIQIAFSSYSTSVLRIDVHREIKGFQGALVSGKALVLKEIERLLRDTDNGSLSPQPLPAEELVQDEEWNTPVE
ncbi:hypothetical protein ID866_8218 [Astraeus odoratus]|nr:hypothetical protein ID866_8218 [Astraeus odoratus]